MGKHLFKIVILFLNITVLCLGEDNVSQTFKRLTDAKPLNSSVHLQRLHSVFIFYLIIKNIESNSYWHITVDLAECRRKRCLCCCLTKKFWSFFTPKWFADVHEWIWLLLTQSIVYNLCATGEEQWCGLTLGVFIQFFLHHNRKMLYILVSGVSSQINAQLNPLHIFIFNWVNLFLLSQSLLESIMAVLIGYSEKRCIGVSLRLQYFAFYFFYHTLTQTPSSVCNIRTKCHFQTQSFTWQQHKSCCDPCHLLVGSPVTPTLERSREKLSLSLSLSHTHQTESSLSFWNMCVSALISSLYIYLSLSYSLSQW